MDTKSTGIIRRIDDLGRLSLPKELRRELKAHEGDAFEVGITTINGRQAFYAVPYFPLGEGILQQIKVALVSLARQLPAGYEVGILDSPGPVASTCTGEQVRIENWWGTVADEAHWMFSETRDRGIAGYRKINEKDVLYYPVYSYGEVALALAIAGNDVSDSEAALVKTAAAVLSAMLS